MIKADTIWMDGELVKWDEAKVHVLTHTLHYGLGVFEGIRCYDTPKGPAVFRLEEHVKRLFNSAHIFQMKIPYTEEQIIEAIITTIKANKFTECYIRPLAFIGAGGMGLYPKDNPVNLAIAAWPWGAYLGEDGLKNGIRVKTSSFIRSHVNSNMTMAKVSGYYVNSQIAKKEAILCGYDEALLLDADGFVSEGSGENIFIVRDGGLKTTPLTSILEGITRDSIITIAKDKGIPVSEARFSRDEIYISDEAFFTGTAAEITPIRELDGRVIGEGRPGEGKPGEGRPGPVTRALQSAFFDAVTGKSEGYERWLTYI